MRGGHKRDCPRNPFHRGNVKKLPKKYCICRGEETEFMVWCNGKDCSIGWFHYGCVGLTDAPKIKLWFCTSCSDRKTRIECDNEEVEIIENSEEEHSPFIPDGEEHCTCRGEDSPDMVLCDGPNCAIGWFHFKCVGLSGPPKTKKWYCSTCSQKLNKKRLND